MPIPRMSLFSELLSGAVEHLSAENIRRHPRFFRFGPFLLQPERQLLTKLHAPVRIGGRALDLLTLLVECAGEIVSKRELLARAWPETFVDEANLKVNVASLRRILGDSHSAPSFIATVAGRGYRFIAAVEFCRPGVYSSTSHTHLRADPLIAVAPDAFPAPLGALKHPERVSGLIVQNGNAYEEGLREFWDPIKAYWAEGTPERRKALASLVTPEITKFQYTDGMGDVSRISPDNWLQDQALLDRPGNSEIQFDLLYDYRTNVPLYPQFQKFFRERQPPTLIVWGKNDFIFPAEGAHPYLRDIPDAELHLLDSGHFALEDRLAEMALLIRDFLDRKVASR